MKVRKLSLLDLNLSALVPTQAEEELAPLPEDALLLKLAKYFSFYQEKGHIIEWGAPTGQFGRLLPALLSILMDEPLLWIKDPGEAILYPNAWQDLGGDLDLLHFVQTPDPLKVAKSALVEKSYPLLIIDTTQFIGTGEMSFISQMARKQNISVFVIRSYFLSSKKGNPFSRFRFNTTLEIFTENLKVQPVKDKNHSPLSLKLSEVFCG